MQQGYTAGEWKTQNWNSGNLTSESAYIKNIDLKKLMKSLTLITNHYKQEQNTKGKGSKSDFQRCLIMLC